MKRLMPLLDEKRKEQNGENEMTNNPVREHWLVTIDTTSRIFLFSKAVRAKRVVCNDGFSFSAQAGRGVRSTPDCYLADGNYSSWEIGFPSEYEELLIPYAEDPDQLIKGVYNFVPTKLVNEIIEKHGGLVGEKEKTRV